MSLWLLLGAAAALSLERVCYVWIARAPEGFRRLCDQPAVAWLGEPVAIVRMLFYWFKALQAAVFAGWWYGHGHGAIIPAEPRALGLALGSVLIVVGQILALLVFYRLGTAGTFYGDRLGHRVPWCRAFPFSVLSHPQYVGAALTIWGLFLVTRFPHDDWFALPVLETVYYTVGTYFETRGEPGPAGDPAGPPVEAAAAPRAAPAIPVRAEGDGSHRQLARVIPST